MSKINLSVLEIRDRYTSRLKNRKENGSKWQSSRGMFRVSREKLIIIFLLWLHTSDIIYWDVLNIDQN